MPPHPSRRLEIGETCTTLNIEHIFAKRAKTQNGFFKVCTWYYTYFDCFDYFD